MLDSTPFGHFFHLEANIRITKKIVMDLLSCFNIDRNAFLVDGEEFYFSGEEASLILGLPFTGNEINISMQGRSIELREKYCTKNGPCRSTRDTFFVAAGQAIESGEIEDAARLLLMFLFSTFLFPAANASTPPALFSYVTDLPALWSYKWGEEVYRYLFAGIRRALLAYQSGRTSVSLNGCCFLLMVSCLLITVLYLLLYICF